MLKNVRIDCLVRLDRKAILARKRKLHNKYAWRAEFKRMDTERVKYLKSAEYKKDAVNFGEFFMCRRFGKRHFSRNSLCRI